MKQTKTRAELELLLMTELRKNPVCSGVDAIAITHGVGRLWNVAPNWIRAGSVKDPRNLMSARNGSWRWQNRVLGLSIFVTTSQLSVTARPMLTPPYSTAPAPGRAFSVTSIPCQYSDCRP